ncbi:MAG: HD domain-containing protein [Verrucomicrobia bacterium]|nr:MAG: HD domain-containing protein [Verrucomicrobiota bacterium]
MNTPSQSETAPAADAAGRLARQMRFIVEADRLKEVFRQSLNSRSRRAENDAEHSWAICLIAMTLAEHANEPIDLLRVLKMLLIHDLVEIDAGDTFAYDTAAMADQHEREARAADRIFGLLPADQAAEFRALWDEFEAGQSADARFANAIDRFHPMLLNCLTEGSTWKKHGVTREKITARNRRIADGCDPLWEYACAMLDRAVAAGHVPAS